MYKVGIDLPKVNDSIYLKFSLILIGSSMKDPERPVYSKFTMNGVDYLKFSPHPFVTLDFNPKKKRGQERDWSKYRSVSLTQPLLLRFLKALKDVVKSIEIPNMFTLVDEKLTLNNELAKEHERGFRAGDKYIKIAPIVVQDDTSAYGDFYEGIILYINTVDFYVCLTYMEAELLYEVLNRIDFPTLSMQLINSALMMKDVESKKYTSTFTQAPVKEEEDKISVIKDRTSELFGGLEEIK